MHTRTFLLSLALLSSALPLPGAQAIKDATLTGNITSNATLSGNLTGAAGANIALANSTVTLPAHFTPYTSVKGPSFAASGGGVSDDRAAIQSAIDAVATAGGGVVFLPAGTYAVSRNSTTNSGLVLKDNVTLAGAGVGATKILYTYSNAATSTAINTSSGIQGASQAVQDAGNTNISVRDLTLEFETTVEASGIGIAFAGVSGGSISRVAVVDVGGYGIFLARNNDATGPDAEGKVTENVTVSDFRVEGFMDVGVELSGAVNCSVSNGVVTGQGAIGNTGVGAAVYVWNGSENCAIANISIYGTGGSNKVKALGLDCYSGANTAVRQTKNITIANVSAYNVWQGIVVNSSTAFGDWSVANSRFFGRRAAGSSGVRLVGTNRAEIRSSLFTDFDFSVAVSNEAHTANQLSCSQLTIVDCILETWPYVSAENQGGTGGEIYGVTSLNFSGNRVINGYAYGVKFFGCRDVVACNNYGYNVGTTANSSLLLFVKNAGSDTREGLNINASNNRIYDDRGTAYSNWAVLLGDATDGVVAIGNNARGGKANAVAYLNAGTGANVTAANNLNN